MKRTSTLSLITTLAVLALAACGKPGTDGAAPQTVATPASTSVPTAAPAAKPSATSGALYQVADGYKVDAETLKGFKTWRAAACDRCHGPNQEGMVGPSLIASLKVLTKEEFAATVTKGRLEKGMPSFATNTQVTESIDALYAYLKGRSDGAITRAKVEPMS